jgi:penicillin-insensitive murein DD-endopeptidase
MVWGGILLQRAGPLCAGLALAIGVATAGAAVAAWGEVTTPVPGPPRVIGSYGGGCIAGAAALPPEGPGYQAVDLERQRHFGHPRTIDYITALGRRAADAGLGPLLIGDIAQPRGGPMSWGHISHQTGLDVDIWYRLDVPPLPRDAREAIPQPGVVDPASGAIDRTLWTEDHVRLLRLAVDDPRVARIFVGPAIKRDLCARDWPDRGWLRLLRPWPGHDGHMHVRLHCPADAPECAPQPALPPGDGCGPELEVWLGPSPPAVATAPARALPPACRAILAR